MEEVRTRGRKCIRLYILDCFFARSFRRAAAIEVYPLLSSARGFVLRKHNHSLHFFILGLAFVLLSACTPKTTEEPLPLEAPENFSNTGAMQLPERWWTVFDDSQLNGLVDSALAANFDLEAAWRRLQAARAVVDRESAPLFPQIDASLQTGISFPQPDFVGGENTRLGLQANYEVDLWGRIRSRVEAERFRRQATLTDYQTAALSLSAEIARIWYRLIVAQNQLGLINQQIETNEQILNLLEGRLGRGQVQGVDIIRQRQLLEATREQRTFAEADVRVLEHQLSVLTGRSPQQGFTYQPDNLPALPPLPETGIPIELVRRRPDIQSAYYRLRAADRDLASAISSKYPRLSISGNTSLRSNSFDNLLREFAYSFAGNILAPIFYGGQLRAEVDRNEAVKQQRLYEYGQTVLIAFREVEDALIQEQKQRESIAYLEEQVNLARQAYERLRTGYLNGTIGYLDVLTALDQEQQLRRNLLAANLTLLEFRIALYRSLAGSIETEREAG